MTNIKAIINDIDGNLIMTEEPCWRLENEIFRQMGIPPMSRAIHKETWGMKLGDAVAVRSGGKADVEEFWQLFPAFYDKFVSTGKLDVVSQDNIDTLKEIRQMSLQHMLLTSRSAAEMVHLMHADHILAKLVDAYYFKENMQFHKPDPRAFEHIEQIHGLKPNECVYVGDQPGDAAAAKGAGLHFIANLEEGLRTVDDFAAYPVDAFISKFTDLPNAIHTIIGKM